MDTDALIKSLASTSAVVRPLPRPGIRTAVWMLGSLAYVALVVSVMTPRPDLSLIVADPRFLLEQSAALMTAMTAALAAFCLNIPDRQGRAVFVPVIPLAVWVGSLGSDCVRTIMTAGWAAVPFEQDWMCIPAIALAGAVPASLMVLMLRRGAPLNPTLSMALGGLAAAGLGSFGLRLFHAEDASLMVLVWQLGTVAVLALLTGAMGRQVINWQRLIGRSRASFWN